MLRARALLLRNAFARRGGARANARAWLDVVLLLAFAALAWFALSRLFERMALDGVPLTDASAALGFLLTLAWIGLAVFDLNHAVSGLVLDSDLELLRRAPLRPAAIALLKLLDALPATGTLMLVLAGPAVAAFARAYPIGLAAWLLLPLQAAAVWAIPLALGLSLALLAVRVLPPRMARDAFGVSAAFTLTVLWLANLFMLPRVTADAGALAQPLVRLGYAWQHVAAGLPSFWWAEALRNEAALAALPAGDGAGPMIVGLLAWNALLITVALLSLAILAAVATHHLEPVLSAVADRPGRKLSARRDAPTARFGGGLIRAVLRRDAHLIARDWPVLSDVAIASLLWVLLPLVAVPLGDVGPASLAIAMVVTLAVALGYEVAARSVPFEREGLLWTRLAPVDPARWAIAKLLGAAAFAVPVLVFAALVVGTVLRPGWASLAPATLVTLSALTTSLALGVWTGLRFGDPRWTNPRAMLRLGGRLLATIGVMVQLVGWLVFLILTGPGGPAHGQPLWSLLPPAIALSATAVLVRAAGRDLGRLELA